MAYSSEVVENTNILSLRHAHRDCVKENLSTDLTSFESKDGGASTGSRKEADVLSPTCRPASFVTLSFYGSEVRSSVSDVSTFLWCSNIHMLFFYLALKEVSSSPSLFDSRQGVSCINASLYWKVKKNILLGLMYAAQEYWQTVTFYRPWTLQENMPFWTLVSKLVKLSGVLFPSKQF